MTFLNPFLLFGLAAAAIPVILHLLNLRKLRTIDFSTLTFLRELQQTRIRRLKLRQVLLLIVRTLMVVFIVLAFARPALRGSLPAGFGGSAGSSVAIVLDDSHSMMASDEGGVRYAQAKASVGGIVSMLREGDAAWLVRLSDLPAVTVDPPTHDFDALRSVVERSSTSYVRRPAGDGLAAAVRLLEGSRDVNREVYLVSDFQATSLEGGGAAPHGGTAPANGDGDAPSGGPAPAPGNGVRVDPRIRLFLVDIGSKDVPNSAVDSVTVVSRIFERNRPVEVEARISNHGPDPLRDAVVSLYDGTTRVAQTNVNVDAGGAATTTLTLVPRRSGIVEGSVAIEADQLDPDNRNYFTFTVPARIRVLVAAGSESDTRFLLPALRAGGTDGEGSPMLITPVGASSLGRESLRDYDVVVLSGVPSLDQGVADRLKAFVTAGGGIVIFPGDGIDPANYNQRVLRPMDLPEIRGIQGGEDGETGLRYREIDFDHPLFSTIFEKDARNSDVRRLSPRIVRALQLRPAPASRSIITLSNGGSFILEQGVGSGRAALFACAPLLSWSDFPMKGLFAPLVYRTVAYLASGGQAPSGRYAVGSEALITLRASGTPAAGGAGARPSAGPAPRYSLRLPDGLSEFIVPVPSGQGLRFRHPLLTLPGQYRLNAGDSVLAVLPANLPPRESDLTKAGAEAVDRFLADRGFDPDQVRRLPPGEELPARITEARFGVELWKYCVALVLLLALLEMAINRRAGGEKAEEA